MYSARRHAIARVEIERVWNRTNHVYIDAGMQLMSTGAILYSRIQINSESRKEMGVVLHKN